MTPRSLARRLIGILPVLALCLATPARAVEETELKAAIIFNILLFVEWPDDALPDAGGVLSLCVAANSPLNAALKALNRRA
ncbi:MAG TPA: YfiR family protein, partial [Albitalea sp.]|nr:YfiR family protein [Albitalea sp.]